MDNSTLLDEPFDGSAIAALGCALPISALAWALIAAALFALWR